MQIGMDMGTSSIAIAPRIRMRAALALAIAADLFQIAVFPIFIEGAASPADDLLDLCMAGAMTYLLGWHWEFAPSFFAKLIPGVDFVPLWTMAVANVYRKSKHLEVKPDAKPNGPVIEGEPAGKSSRTS